MGQRNKKICRSKIIHLFPIGFRFGNRTVIGVAPTNRGYAMLNVICDCGNETIISAVTIKKGKAQRCIQCTSKNQTGNKSHAWKGGKYIPLTLYNRWKKSAKKRSIKWNLTIEELDDLIKKQSWKCAISNQNLILDFGQNNGSFQGNASLDRKNNDEHYYLNNVWFVTKDINMAKQCLTTEKFIEMCTKVHNNAINNYFS